MVANNWEFQTLEITESVLPVSSSITLDETPVKETYASPGKFHSHHQDCMEMCASKGQVAEYLNCHSLWFMRCAEPMRVEPLGNNGYALVVGRFGGFGYEVEPKIGLELLALQQNKYQIRTIPVPDYQAPGYDVEYNASLELVDSLPGMTRVEWNLDLMVDLHFPRFIQRLPYALIQSTGDRLLHQIVRQVSRRLTQKVQEDFHRSLNIPFHPQKKFFGH